MTIPANYKEIVAAWMKPHAFDSSRIEWQSEPKPADMPGKGRPHLYGYLVIFNTPEQSHAKTRSVLIRDGAVINNSGSETASPARTKENRVRREANAIFVKQLCADD